LGSTAAATVVFKNRSRYRKRYRKTKQLEVINNGCKILRIL
jgi:hypothetical protein